MSSAVELVKRGFAANSAGDLATLNEVIADDAVWVAEGVGILSGRYEGKAAIFENWALLPVESQGTFQQDVVEVFGDDHVVVAITEMTADRRGKHLEKARGAFVFVVKNGQVSEGRAISSDRETFDAFWAE